MTRVSQNSTSNALNYAVNRTKAKLEDLHLKGSTLKRIVKPSDDPSGNIDVLKIRSENADISQFRRNSLVAKTQLEFTEAALNDISDVVNKAKEIAIGQASDTYPADVRQNVAAEVREMRHQLLAVANRRLGNKYIFAGHKTNSSPFDTEGNYFGNDKDIFLEVSQGNFVPINLNGRTVFLGDKEASTSISNPFSRQEKDQKVIEGDFSEADSGVSLRAPASIEEEEDTGSSSQNIFKQLERLETALMTNNSSSIKELLNEFDDSLNRIITLRTRVGAVMNTVAFSEDHGERTKISNEAKKSQVEDADIAELFSDITKQQNILQASYKAGTTVLNKSLLDFLK